MAPALPPLETAPLYEFTSHLRFADHWMEVEAVIPARWDHRQHLTAGWSFPGGDAEEDRTRSPVWIDSDHAEITFLLREVGLRTVRGRLVPFQAVAQEGPLSLRPSLNGTPLPSSSIERGGTTLALELPVEAQRRGLNVLALDFGKAWRVRDYVEDSGDLRRLAAQSTGLSFVSDDPELDRRRKEALRMAPTGVEAIAFAGEEEPRDVSQLSGTVLRYHLRIPSHARFQAHVSLAARGERAGEDAIFRLRATSRDGADEVLAEVQVRRGESPHLFEAPLGPWAGRIVRLDFEVAAPGDDAEPLLGLWSRPVLLPDGDAGEDDAAPAPDSPALAAARGALKQAPVVLVLLDACNPAFLTAYGGREDLTPNLDRLAAEGTLFRTAYSQASYTISAVPSILTSTYTWQHGTWNETSRMSDDVDTWPTLFGEAGYRTVGLICSPNGSSVFGMERGFDEYHELFHDIPEGRLTVLAEEILAPLDAVLEVVDERPLFLWMHIIEPHEPYSPPSPWAGSIAPETEDRLTGSADDLWDIRERRVQPTEADLVHIAAQYEENIAYVDDVMARVRARLDAAGVFEEAIVVVFSDHGEAFLRHDSKDFAGMGHGSTVYDDMARIPLLVRLPAGVAPPGRVVDAVVSNMDIMTTVADLVGLPSSPADSRGISFSPLLFGEAEPARDSAVSHSISRDGSRRFLPSFSLRWEEWKYIHTSGDAAELYDLGADPDEMHNVIAEHRVLAGYLRQRLREETGFDLDAGGLNVGLSGTTEISDELREKMRALGYAR